MLTSRIAYVLVKGQFLKGKITRNLLEPLLAKEARYSYWYARNVLHGPFKLGEEAIAKDAWYSYLYAKDILHGPFRLGEAAIAKEVNYSYWYALYVLHLPKDQARNWRNRAESCFD